MFLGRDSGKDVTSANNKLYIQNGYINPEHIMYGDFETGNIALGNTDPNGYRLYINGDAYATGQWISSDQRYKKGRKKIGNALEMIDEIEGVTYTFKAKIETNALRTPEGVQYGIMAQELEEVIPELVRTHKDGYKAINYQGLIPVLIEAIKEVKSENTLLREELNTIKELITNNAGNTNNNEAIPLQSIKDNMSTQSRLFQNIPNPSKMATRIAYYVPLSSRQVTLHIFDLSGKKMKTYLNLRSGDGEVTITNNELTSGMYHYSLTIEGRILDTKKMIIE